MGVVLGVSSMKGLGILLAALVCAAIGCELVASIEERKHVEQAAPAATGQGGAAASGGQGQGAGTTGGSSTTSGGSGGVDPCGEAGGSADRCADCPLDTCDCDGNPGNGCERDLALDPAHCGACNHDCLGGTCAGGSCEPTLIATGSINHTSFSGHIAVDDARVYWVEPAVTGADVLAVDHDGQNPEVLVLDDALTHAIEVDASYLYWARWNQFGLYRVDKGGGMPVLLESVGFQPVALALDATYLYWLTTPLRPTNGEAHIGRVPKLGGSGAPLTNAPVNPNDLAIAGSWLYWVEYSAKAIHRIKTDGTDEGLLYATTGNPDFIVADGNDLYWTESVPDAVMWAPADGQGSAMPLSSEPGAPHEIAADATHIYWSNDAGEVRRLRRDGCDAMPVVMADGFADMHAVVLSGDSVFFTSSDGIWRIAK